MEQPHFFLSIFLGLVCSIFFTCAYAIEYMNTPEGYWKIIDSTTGKPKSIVQIWKTPNHMLVGKVVKLFSKKGRSVIQRCTACRGIQYNQPIIGMIILSGLKQKQHQWSNGRLLNPENGKTYSCALRAMNNGNKLNVRNYIGLPIFGRAETWERVDLMSN
ncbi:MAG: hypothetical protein K0S63_868 [Gammaproteobacteria bacterium]|jgi:uncharacterized protein (DUF2147 family)|nr:hypothetical protein [Gammaproteobacteria bacterium]